VPLRVLSIFYFTSWMTVAASLNPKPCPLLELPCTQTRRHLSWTSCTASSSLLFP